MSEATKQEQQEPSMEEILASIRRIISDDGSEQQGQSASEDAANTPSPDTEASSAAGPETDASNPEESGSAVEADAADSSADIDVGSVSTESDEATDVASESSGAIELRSDESAPEESGQDPVAAEEEPLELTQAVQGDGTVIDLAAERAAQARANAATTEPAADLQAESNSVEEAAPEVPAEPAPLDEPEQGESEPVEAGELESASPSESEPEPEPVAEDEPFEMPQAEADPIELAPEVAEEDMSESPKIDTAEHEHLVSEATEAATLAALSSVVRSPETDQAAPLAGGERTLEQVVRDAIAEHLKVWLDANLPDLVERVVREEVRRLARRAEDT